MSVPKPKSWLQTQKRKVKIFYSVVYRYEYKALLTTVFFTETHSFQTYIKRFDINLLEISKNIHKGKRSVDVQIHFMLNKVMNKERAKSHVVNKLHSLLKYIFYVLYICNKTSTSMKPNKFPSDRI
jgi:hypothetical protein